MIAVWLVATYTALSCNIGLNEDCALCTARSSRKLGDLQPCTYQSCSHLLNPTERGALANRAVSGAGGYIMLHVKAMARKAATHTSHLLCNTPIRVQTIYMCECWWVAIERIALTSVTLLVGFLEHSVSSVKKVARPDGSLSSFCRTLMSLYGIVSNDQDKYVKCRHLFCVSEQQNRGQNLAQIQGHIFY